MSDVSLGALMSLADVLFAHCEEKHTDCHTCGLVVAQVKATLTAERKPAQPKEGE